MHGKIAQSDVFPERGRRAAASDPAGWSTVQINFVAVAADSAAGHFETHQLAGDALLFLFGERRMPNEIALVEFDDPGQIRFIGSYGRMDLVAVKRHLGFEAQGIARAQSTGFDAEFGAGIQNLKPDSFSLIWRDVDLESVLAGVAGAGDAS